MKASPRALAGARFDSVIRRGKFLVFTLLLPYAHDPAYAGSPTPPHTFLVIIPKLTSLVHTYDNSVGAAWLVKPEITLE